MFTKRVVSFSRLYHSLSSSSSTSSSTSTSKVAASINAVPFKEEYYIDSRKRGEREIVHVMSSNGKINNLRTEVIDEKDIDLIGNFYNYHFVKNGNLWKSLSKFFKKNNKFHVIKQIF